MALASIETRRAKLHKSQTSIILIAFFCPSLLHIPRALINAFHAEKKMHFVSQCSALGIMFSVLTTVLYIYQIVILQLIGKVS